MKWHSYGITSYQFLVVNTQEKILPTTIDKLSSWVQSRGVWNPKSLEPIPKEKPKVSMPYMATLLNWMRRFEWSMNKHQNHKCYNEIGLCVQNMYTTIQSHHLTTFDLLQLLHLNSGLETWTTICMIRNQ